MKRTTEFILGLIGGSIGLLWSTFWLLSGLGNMSTLFTRHGTASDLEIFGFYSALAGAGMILMCAVAIIFSIPAIMNKNNKLAGGLIMAAGILGLIPGFIFFWLIPGTLLIISGAMALRDPLKKENNNPSNMEG